MNSTELPSQDGSRQGGAAPRPSLLRPLELAAVGLYAFASQPNVTRFKEKDFLALLQQHEVDIKQAIEKAKRDFMLVKIYPQADPDNNEKSTD